METLQKPHVREPTENEKRALLKAIWLQDVETVWELTGTPDVIWGSITWKLKPDDFRWMMSLFELLPEESTSHGSDQS